MFWSSLAWGHYWLWEPKQLTCIALWFYYLAGLHLRLQKGMQGRAFAMLCLLGLPLLLMTWMGTNTWTQGLHNFTHG
jgi:ABC-type transport system involved in cytochrome c biogenesis permease subunit